MGTLPSSLGTPQFAAGGYALFHQSPLAGSEETTRLTGLCSKLTTILTERQNSHLEVYSMLYGVSD